jgi:hypothetical protein
MRPGNGEDMRLQQVRALLALTVVGVFMAITAFMAVFPLVSDAKVALVEYADFFVKTASVYTGIIGVIIGNYFGRAGETLGAAPKDAGATGAK